MLSRGLLACAALLALAPSALAAGPSSRMYQVSLTGTQQSEWSFTESGTCTGDDFEEHQFSGAGSGTSTVSINARPLKSAPVRCNAAGRS